MLYPGLSFSSLALHGRRVHWDQAWVAPDGTRPSLLLDFAQGVYGIAGNQVANPLPGSRVGRPEVDHAAPGLIVEPARVNLVTNSAASTANWVATAATLGNLSLGALGLFAGLSVASTGATWNRAGPPAIAYAAATDYSVTFWYRAGTSGIARLNLYVANPATNIEVGGAVGALQILATTGATVSAVDNTDLGGGNWRVRVTYRLNNAVTAAWGIGPSSATSGLSVIALAAQVEQAVAATGYIATSGSALPRTADAHSLAAAGWAGANAGSLVLTARAESTLDVVFAWLDNGTGATLTLYRAASGEIRARRVDGGGAVETGSGVSVARGDEARVALGWDESSLALAVNGAAAVTAAAPGMLTPSLLAFHATALGETHGPALTARLRHYARRLDDATLAAITA